MKHLEFEYTPQEHLTIAQEGIASAMTAGLDMVSSMKDRLLEHFPSILRGFGGNDDLSQLQVIPKLSAYQTKFLTNLSRVSYAELREMSAQVPEGMSATYLDYLRALKPVVLHLTTMLPKVLNPYSVLLGTLVSSKQAAISANDHAAHYAELEADREAMYASMAKCFSKTSHASVSKVSKVVESNQQWAEVFHELKAVTDMLDSIDRDQVKQVSKHCEDYLEIIYGNLKADRMDDVSLEAAKAISTGAYACACELEMFSIAYYRVAALVNSIEVTTATISTVLEQ